MARKNEPYIYKVLRREAPNPRQQAFFRAEAANIAYGGARGGGKSWAMRRKLVLLAMRYPGLKLLLLRRTLPELRANHILPLQRELGGLRRVERRGARVPVPERVAARDGLLRQRQRLRPVSGAGVRGDRL